MVQNTNKGPPRGANLRGSGPRRLGLRGRTEGTTALGGGPACRIARLAGDCARVSEPEATRWTGRPGYPIRSMIGIALAKSIYAVPTWSRVVALVTEHPALRAAITGGTPMLSVYACYRFPAKLRLYGDMLDACLDRGTAALHVAHPDMGTSVAIDGPTCPPTRTASGTCSTAAPSASATPTRTPRGNTARPCPRARTAGSTARSSTWPSVPRRAVRSRGRPHCPR